MALFGGVDPLPWGAVSPDDPSPSAEPKRTPPTDPTTDRATEPGLSRLLAHAPCAAYEIDPAKKVRWWNDAAAELFGWTAAEVVGQPLPPGCRDTPVAQKAIMAALDAGRVVDRQPTVRTHRDGAALSLTVSIELILDESGRPMGEVVLAVPARDDENTMTRSQLASVLENMSEAVTLLDEGGHVLYASDVRERDLGYERDFWIGRDVRDLLHPDDASRAHDQLRQLSEHPGVPLTGQFRMRHASGHWEHLEVTAVDLLGDPRIQSVVLTSRRVTDQAMAAIAEAGAARTLGLIAGDSPMADAIAEACSIIGEAIPGTVAAVVIEDAHDHMTSIHATETFPDELRQAMLTADAVRAFGSWGATMRSGEETIVNDLATSAHYEQHRELLARSGLKAAVALPLSAPAGSAAVLVTYLDQTRGCTDAERRIIDQVAHLVSLAMQRDHDLRQLSHQALHDDLTGLPNRAMLHEHLSQALRVAANHSSAVGIIFLDLDDFKLVNDSLGHSVGDLVLQGFASRLILALRPGDAVGRFGGDEFVIVLENVAGADDAAAVAERLLADLRRPIAASNSEIFLTASVGIAISTADDTPDTLLHDADAAMYEAKARGRSCIEVHDRVASSRSSRRLTLQNDLRRAIDGGEFELRWQPKIELATGNIAGAEVLVRWQHPVRGLLLPTQFVPEAEESGLIGELGSWVLEQAIGAATTLHHRWPDQNWTVAVNVSGRQLAATGFVADVANILRRADFPAKRVILELTESYMMADAPTVIGVLQRLRDTGVSVAIDDFGTGYSSLAYLHQLPIDAVKLDRAFVDGIEADGSGSPIATAVMHIAHALDLKVIAEGIEHQRQLDGLREINCDWVQGNLLHAPLEFDQFAALMEG